MQLIVNGAPRDLEAPLVIEALLGQLKVDPRLVAVAVNGEVVARRDYGVLALAEGDRVEVVRMVGGG